MPRWVCQSARIRPSQSGADASTRTPVEDYYIDAWQASAGDAAFRQPQDDVVDREYYDPAMEAADRLGLRTALARAQLYDTRESVDRVK